jgi:hypothetical protein
MARIVEELTVPVPPRVAFAYVADFTNTVEWDPQIDAARRRDEGPLGTGSAFDVELRLGSRHVTMTYTITSYQPDAQVVLETSGAWYRGRDVVDVRPGPDGGSIVRWDATFALRGPLIVLEPLMALGFRRTATKAVAGLATALRGLPGASPGADPRATKP